MPNPDTAIRCTVHSFKPSGKWYSSARGFCQLELYHGDNRQRFLNHNNGKVPGLVSASTDLFHIIIPDEDTDGIPFMIPALGD